MEKTQTLGAKAAQAETQRKWLDQQKLKNEMKRQAEADEKAAYAMQVQQITRMRAMLEEGLARKQREMATSPKIANVKLKQEFKDNQRNELSKKFKEKDDDYARQTQIRIVDPYQNPLN